MLFRSWKYYLINQICNKSKDADDARLYMQINLDHAFRPMIFRVLFYFNLNFVPKQCSQDSSQIKCKCDGKGLPGEPGYKGPAGQVGKHGSLGPVGFQGSKGLKGDEGQEGRHGAKGEKVPTTDNSENKNRNFNR
jgi:hypothetical protein